MVCALRAVAVLLRSERLGGGEPNEPMQPCVWLVWVCSCWGLMACWFAARSLARAYNNLGIEGERVRRAIRGRKSLYMATAEKRRVMDSKGQSSSRTTDDVSRHVSEDVFSLSWVNLLRPNYEIQKFKDCTQSIDQDSWTLLITCPYSTCSEILVQQTLPTCAQIWSSIEKIHMHKYSHQ